jgi:hypothetical protein
MGFMALGDRFSLCRGDIKRGEGICPMVLSCQKAHLEFKARLVPLRPQERGK